MKKILLAALIGSLSMTVSATEWTEDQQVSYIIGSQMGESLKMGEVDSVIKLDQDLLFDGVKDVLADNKLKLSDEEMQKAMTNFGNKLMERAKKAAEKAKKAAEAAKVKNKEEAEKLLASNKGKDGVKVTDSGLQYRVITEGKKDGKKPSAESTVKVNYKGSFADGKVFDSSYEGGEPIEFPLGQVIPGWTEGLQLMTEGSKYEFVIPAKLAYGEQGPSEIGPERALIFEVELLEVK
ncbi:MAG: peptidylprolyl isomerase [Gammaproteobacteria bacterium]|nr:MAG: peptidylprolyl isomerase [Gammaproteobacteria bacterium]